LGLEELVDLFESLRLGRQLFLDISCCENVLEIDPLLLAIDPLFNYLIEGEEVLLPDLCLSA